MVIDAHSNILYFAANVGNSESKANPGRRGGGRAGIVAFGIADLPHSGMWPCQGHSESSWNRTGSRDRPAGRSRNRPRDKSGDRSGGMLRSGRMTAVA